jgi:integrase
MLQSRRESSNKQYANHIRKWNTYCKTLKLDPTFTTVPVALDFLQTLFDAELTYSSINTAKAAINTVVILPGSQTLGASVDTHTFMRGVFNLRPPKTRHLTIWDPDKVLVYFRSKEPTDKLTTELLAKKLATLILLVSGQRPQILVALRLSDLQMSDDVATFVISNKDVKQGRPGYVPPPVVLRSYHDNRLCVLAHI